MMELPLLTADRVRQYLLPMQTSATRIPASGHGSTADLTPNLPYWFRALVLGTCSVYRLTRAKRDSIVRYRWTQPRVGQAHYLRGMRCDVGDCESDWRFLATTAVTSLQTSAFGTCLWRRFPCP
jgi:hypothetical protein